MLIELYTDASVLNKRGVTSCLLLTTDNFIGCSSKKYDNVYTSLQGELLAIRDGLEYLKTTGKTYPVKVYCDSYSALQLVQNPDPRRFRKLLDQIHEFESGLEITYELIEGHQNNHNPNKVVDLLCKAILRTV